MLETPAMYAATPSFAVDGRNALELGEGLLTLLIEERGDGLARCEASYGNWGSIDGNPGYRYFDRGLLDFGTSIDVSIGGGVKAGPVFSGAITGLEGQYPQHRPPEIVVLAEDRLQDLRMTRRTRTFEDVTDADVIRRIASEHGLSADVDVDGPSHRVVSQVNQSDLAFLRARADAVDAQVGIDGTSLRVQVRGRSTRGRIELTYGRDLHEFSVLADLAGQRTTLTVGGWDVAGKEGIEAVAGAEAIRPELNGHDAGGQIVEERFGRRPERLVHLAPLGGAEAKVLADARFRRMARRFVTGRGTAECDARIRVGATVALSSLGPLFNGDYQVTEVTHTFRERDGCLTHFSVERPGLGRVGR